MRRKRTWSDMADLGSPMGGAKHFQIWSAKRLIKQRKSGGSVRRRQAKRLFG